MTDTASAPHPADTAEPLPLVGWRRRRDLAGQVLEFSAQMVRPRGGVDDPGRLRQALSLAASFLPQSIESRRSIWSVRSMYSASSVVSLGSVGSLLSAGSAGSILSIGSVGSVLSIGSAGSVLSIGGFGKRSGRWQSSPEPSAAVRHLGTVAGALAVAGAVANAATS